jgi:hypothetical protein
MIQGARRLGFTQEASHGNRIALGGEDFERHSAAELKIFRQIYDAHAASTELLDDLEMADGFAGLEHA